ncbi:MAG: SAM-dependent methyltransferase, partial [Actinomycetota bacterium]|nr:SAM-dependent methyltransferase [Actinomycetota bacterium]
MTLAEVLETLSAPPTDFRFTAYDGSSSGPADASVHLHLRTPRGAAYLATAPGSLGLARAYIGGDLEISGVHPGDPYAALRVLGESLTWRRPRPAEMRSVAAAIGVRHLLPPPAPPAQEAAPEWRRMLSGTTHSRQRDASAIS